MDGEKPTPAAGEATPGSMSGAGHSVRRLVGQVAVYQGLADFGLTGGIWMLYLQSRGLSIAEIGVAEAAFHLAPVVLELPSGSFADVLGRKWSMAIGPALAALSLLLMLRVDSIWMAVIAMFIGGSAYAFRSGASQAYVYDALKSAGESSSFTKVMGRLFSLMYVTIALGTWLGGVLAESGFWIPYVLAAAVSIAAAVCAALLPEPPRDQSSHRSMTRTLREAGGVLRERPNLRALTILGTALATAMTLISLYSQVIYAERGLDTGQIGFIIGIVFMFTASGTWIAARVANHVSFTRWAVPTITMVAALGLCMATVPLLALIPFYFLTEFTLGVLEAQFSTEINRETPSAQRATILSVQGFLFSLTMIWAFPLFGFAAERIGWTAAYGITGVLLLLALAGWLMQRRGSTPQLAEEAA